MAKVLQSIVQTVYLLSPLLFATVLSWAFERLLCHPEVEQRLREELDAAEPSAIDALPYLDAVINEVMRQRPPFRWWQDPSPCPSRSQATSFRRECWSARPCT